MSVKSLQLENSIKRSSFEKKKKKKSGIIGLDEIFQSAKGNDKKAILLPRSGFHHQKLPIYANFITSKKGKNPVQNTQLHLHLEY